MISQTLGLDIIKSDLQRITTFLRSFVKVRAINANEYPSTSQRNELSNKLNTDESELHRNNELSPFQGSAKGTDSQLLTAQLNDQLKPRSKIGRAVASKYIEVRGTFDRTFEGVSLATEALFLSVLARAGTAIYYILQASDKAFPALSTGPVKRVAEQMVHNEWSPLKTFEWQTAALSNVQMLRDNRRSRIAYIEQYLRGNPGGTYTQALSLLSRGANSTFSVFETTTPVLFRGASKVASASFRAFRAASQGKGNKKKGTSPENQKGLPIAASWSTAPDLGSFAPSDKKRVPKRTSSSRISTMLSGQLAAKVVLPSNPIVPKRRRSAISGKAETPGKTGKRPSTDVNGQTENHMLQKGGAVLGVGMLMMAISGLSLPTYITVSAVLVTTMGVTQARAAEMKGEIYQKAREAFRQSKSVRKLETIIKPSNTPATQRYTGENKKSLKAAFTDQFELVSVSMSSAQRTRKREIVPKPVEVEPEDIIAVDVEAFSVSRPEPSILSAPILGQVLNHTDEVAFAVEKLSDQLSYRLRSILGARQESSSWILLKSFIEHTSDFS
ncbi:hypothetical protein BWQ96_09822 [Gracilariopsis chorda]|uniref:Uncharacterized protein n=1 Tax=Gracilariopsis chorda TaxID=448386 RepID=A0A2V3IEI3_9FLOR|nr:hypothetical protein BWQ96_09822 [Gracilariopsis chorda]|eukprot:PXF40473.1 hypothetical protein BWQ96_09822 [Gracilariopsis chorda]